MNQATIARIEQREGEPWRMVSKTQYFEPLPRWRLLIPNFSSAMTTITASLLLMITGAAMMLTNTEQFMIIGSVIAGSAFGSIFQVTRSLITKSESEVPRQIILYRFASHASGGTTIGSGICLALIYWFHVEMPLVLMGVAVGSFCGWMSERIAKRYEPKILQMLEDAGRIPRPLPPDTKAIDLTVPTKRISKE